MSLFRQKATKYRRVFLPTIIKEIQTGAFTKSTDYVTYRSKEYKRHMLVTPKRNMHVPIIDHYQDLATMPSSHLNHQVR